MLRYVKGQSAIEYLMTYGWMLLVVAVVGGSFYSLSQSQTLESTSGFTGGDIIIEEFGLNSEDQLGLLLRNINSRDVTVKNIEITDNQGSKSRGFNQRISATNAEALDIEGFQDTYQQNTIDVIITYDTGGLSNLQTSGTISSSIGVNPEIIVSVSDDWSAPSPEPQNCETVWKGMDGEGTTQNPKQVSNGQELQCINYDLVSDYTLVQNIDLTNTTEWNNGEGFRPIGDNQASGTCGDDRFCGTLEGNNRVIEGLYIDSSERYNGLFGYIDGSEVFVRNIGFENANITSSRNIAGGLAGRADNADIIGIDFNGDITLESSGSTGNAGGILGIAVDSVNIEDSTANVTLTIDGSKAGGIIGDADTSDIEIRNVSSSGTVIADNGYVGGIAGQFQGLMIDSSSSAVVQGGANDVGGLAGWIVSDQDVVTRSYSTGDVTGVDNAGRAGGIAGNSHGLITQSYSTGDITADGVTYGIAAGIVGASLGEISNVYALGDVSNTKENTGGLVAAYAGDYPANQSFFTGNILNSGGIPEGAVAGSISSGSEIYDIYWDAEVNRLSSASEAIGENEGTSNIANDEFNLQTSEMQGSSAETNMDKLDFVDVWVTTSGYPEFQWQQ